MSTREDTRSAPKPESEPERKVFQYQKLPAGKWIRLLELLPSSSKHSVLECKLFHADFAAAEQTPNFEPISYAWGDPTATDEIVCNDLPLAITRSLSSVLWRLRYAHKSRILWADGICINQRDNAEKSHQVAFMSDIYQRGACTLVWLGEKGDHSLCDAVDDLGCVEGTFRLITEVNDYVEEEFEKRKDPTQDQTVWNVIHRIAPIRHGLAVSPERFRCVKHFFDRPWFSRCWVLGEVAVSKNAIVFCGDISIAWSEIAFFGQVSDTDILGPQAMQSGGLGEAFNALWSMIGLDRAWIMQRNLLKVMTDHVLSYKKSLGDEIRILDLAELSRCFSATVGHDHVYAFFGHPSLRGLVEPNYERTVDETNRKVAERILEVSEFKSLDMLCYVQNREEDLLTQSSSSLPTWVLQWHRENPEAVDFRPEWEHLRDQDVVASLSGDRLHITALVIDKIVNRSRTLHGAQFREKHADAAMATDEPHDTHVIEELWTMFPSDTETFLWTVCAGSYPRRAWLAPDFLAYCSEYCSASFVANTISAADDSFFKQDPDANIIPSASRFLSQVFRYNNCTFFTTGRGGFGRGPGILREGDVLAIAFGCRMPLILRPTGKDEEEVEGEREYKYVGPCFINDLMYDGRWNYAAKEWRSGVLKKSNITLV